MPRSKLETLRFLRDKNPQLFMSLGIKHLRTLNRIRVENASRHESKAYQDAVSGFEELSRLINQTREELRLKKTQ